MHRKYFCGGVQPLIADAEYTGLMYDDYLYYLKIDKDKDGVYDYAVITDCNESAVSIEIPSEIMGLPVTRIGDSAFSSCGNLTSVSIPDTVNVIEDGAFMLTGITEIKLPNNLLEIDGQAFCYSELKNINIPDTVKLIGDGAFSSCSSLENVELGNSVESIGSSAFEYCKVLSEITIPDSVRSIGANAFENTPLISNQSGIKYADTWVVGCDKNFNSVEIKEGTKGIAQYTFEGYDGLEEVTIPDTLEIIDSYAFLNCPDIKNISTGGGVKKICDSAFSGCTGLKSFVMGESVETIEDGVFYNCTKLEDITIPPSAVHIMGNAFGDTPWLAAKREENPFVVVNSILIDATTIPLDKDFEIPENVKTIGSYAFQIPTKGFINVTLPESVTKIEQNGFNGFAALDNIIIKNPDCEIIDNGYIEQIKPDEYGVPAFEPDYGGTICNAGLWGEFFYYGKIVGYKNSTAQAYAEKCNITFVALDEEPTVTTPTVTTTVTTTTITVATTVSTTEETTNATTTETVLVTTTKATETVPVTTAPVTTTEPEVPGDISGNGKIDLYDAIEICKSIMGMRTFTDEEKAIADYNSDGVVDLYDAIGIAKELLPK